MTLAVDRAIKPTQTNKTRWAFDYILRIIFFNSPYKNMWFSLEFPHLGYCNEHPQHITVYQRTPDIAIRSHRSRTWSVLSCFILVF